MLLVVQLVGVVNVAVLSSFAASVNGKKKTKQNKTKTKTEFKKKLKKLS